MQHKYHAAVLVCILLLVGTAYAQDFSWRMGPVDISTADSAKLIFANPFCPNPLTKLDVTLAITDLSGHVAQMRTGSQLVPARKHAIVSCDEALELDVDGNQLAPNGTLVGVLQIITDIGGVPWVPVNVPLASLQVGHRTGNDKGKDDDSMFQARVVIIPVEPLRRLILP